jgi:hypothetical protein
MKQRMKEPYGNFAATHPCANERPSGFVRGATRNGCPYRARQLSVSTVVLTDESLCENIRGPLELRDMDL